MLDDLAPARRRLVLGSLGLLLAVVLGIALVLIEPQLTRGGHKANPAPQNAQPPVLLVPGLRRRHRGSRRDGRRATPRGPRRHRRPARRRRHRRPQRPGRRPRGRRAPGAQHRRGVGRPGRLLRRRRDRAPVGAAVRRRVGRPAHRHPGLAPARHRPRLPRRRPRTRQVPGGLSAAGHRQRPDPAAQQRGRDACRPAVGLDLDHRRHHLHPAPRRRRSRARWTSRCSRSAPASPSPTASSPRARS